MTYSVNVAFANGGSYKTYRFDGRLVEYNEVLTAPAVMLARSMMTIVHPYRTRDSGLVTVMSFRTILRRHVIPTKNSSTYPYFYYYSSREIFLLPLDLSVRPLDRMLMLQP